MKDEWIKEKSSLPNVTLVQSKWPEWLCQDGIPMRLLGQLPGSKLWKGCQGLSQREKWDLPLPTRPLRYGTLSTLQQRMWNPGSPGYMWQRKCPGLLTGASPTSGKCPGPSLVPTLPTTRHSLCSGGRIGSYTFMGVSGFIFMAGKQEEWQFQIQKFLFLPRDK